MTGWESSAEYRTVVGGGDGEEAKPAAGWTFAWVDRAARVALLRAGGRSLRVLVEGSGPDWFVTLHGRRVEVSVRSRREQLLAEAARASASGAGPVDVTATLPGLIVAVETTEGSEVAAGDSLLTIEAMKMQNEVRAPRAGRVATISVSAGQTVGTGQLLLRLE
jgi:biotin carboxyl carrier protein